MLYLWGLILFAVAAQGAPLGAPWHAGSDTTWHVVWTGGQSNSVGTNTQQPGTYPVWPSTNRIQMYCAFGSRCTQGTFAPASVPLYNEDNVGFSQTFANYLLQELPSSDGIILLNTGWVRLCSSYLADAMCPFPPSKASEVPASRTTNGRSRMALSLFAALQLLRHWQLLSRRSSMEATLSTACSGIKAKKMLATTESSIMRITAHTVGGRAFLFFFPRPSSSLRASHSD